MLETYRSVGRFYSETFQRRLPLNSLVRGARNTLTFYPNNKSSTTQNKCTFGCLEG